MNRKGVTLISGDCLCFLDWDLIFPLTVVKLGSSCIRGMNKLKSNSEYKIDLFLVRVSY